jgi:hypothetical protein
MKTLRFAAVALLAFASAFCTAGAPAFAQAAPKTPPAPTQNAPKPPSPPTLTPAEIAKLLPEPKAPNEPSMWYGPFDLRTASIA